MKLIKKSLITALMIFTFVCISITASAATTTVGNVTRLTAKAASETSIKLSWNKAAKATGYTIYRINPETGAATKVATTSKTSYTLKKLSTEQSYTFRVSAYRKVKKVVYQSETMSPMASVALTVKTPGNPSGLKVSSLGNETVNLKWNKAKNANGYNIYMQDPDSTEYKLIGTTTKNTFSTKKLTNGVSYKFVVMSYRTAKGITKTGGYSNEISAAPRAYSAAVQSVHSRWYNVTFRRTVTVPVLGTNDTIQVKAGTSGVSESCGGTYVNVKLSKGARVRVYINDLKFHSLSVTKTAYSTKVKEAFVNEKGYSSNTRYLIWISQYTLNVNVFQGSRGNWKLVRSMPCIIGQWGTMTPQGVFKTCRRDSAYGGPRVYFTWNNTLQQGNSFHRRVDGHTHGAYSHGCIRLSDSNLNYIVSRPMGTTVVSY